ncbi:MAG: hypothetical protein S4CHLAM7_10160 [Chlamydiae bacterium]|nr:hypothetical protein [Chlamydiota bacterium]
MIKKQILLLLLFLGLTVNSYISSEMYWSDPLPLYSGSEINQLQTAINFSGYGIATWVELEESKQVYNLLYSLCDHGKWTKPNVITSAKNFEGQSISVNRLGKIIAAWKANQSDSSIQVVIIEKGELSEIINIKQGPKSEFSSPKVCLDDQGNGLLGYTNSKGELLSFKYNINRWSPAETIAQNISKISNFDLKANEKGEAIAVWVNLENCIEGRIYNGSNWAHNSAVISENRVATNKQIIASFSCPEHPSLVWVEENPTYYTLNASWYDNQWIDPVTAGDFGEGKGEIQYALRVNSKGQSISARGGQNGYLKTTLYTIGGLATESLMSTRFDPRIDTLDVSINEQGDCAVFWKEQENTLLANIFFKGQWLSAGHKYQTTAREKTANLVTFDNSNQAILTWVSQNITKRENTINVAFGKENLISSSQISLSLEPRTTPLDPNRTQKNIKVSWSTNDLNLVEKYYLYRNNFLIAILSKSDCNYIDKLYKGFHVYKLEALDENNQIICSSSIKTN